MAGVGPTRSSRGSWVVISSWRAERGLPLPGAVRLISEESRLLVSPGSLDDEAVTSGEADTTSVEHGIDDRVDVEVDDLDLEAVCAVELGDIGGGATGDRVSRDLRGAPASWSRCLGLFVVGHDGMVDAGALRGKGSPPRASSPDL